MADNVNVDPLFADPSSDDLHLLPSSTAIDAGIAIPMLVTDYDGVSRPQGAGIDLGAFEAMR